MPVGALRQHSFSSVGLLAAPAVDLHRWHGLRSSFTEQWPMLKPMRLPELGPFGKLGHLSDA